MEKFPVSDWQVERARITAFLTPEPVNSSAWWHAAEIEPDAIEQKPKASELQITGLGSVGRLRLLVDPVRVEWRLEHPGLSGPPDTIPTIGTLSDVSHHLTGVAGRWLSLPTAPRVVRLAVGVVLLHAEASGEDAMRRLGAYLPVNFGNGTVYDFVFRINRRRGSKVMAGLQLNRLNTWTRALFTPFAMQQTGANTILRAHFDPADAPGGQYFVRAELDVNSVPKMEGLPPESLIPLVQELADLAFEIAEQGDCA